MTPKISRRHVIKMGMAIPSVSLLHSSTALAGLFTPEQTQGPFYPLTRPEDSDFDLIHIDGHDNTAMGTPIRVVGRISNSQGNPIGAAHIEIWQANAQGRYHHPDDANRAPLDPDFQGYGTVISNVQGEYQFKTVLPGAYPATSSWTRPPHIHFKIKKHGYQSLTTQMYFPGEGLNQADRILQSLSPHHQAQLISVKRIDSTGPDPVHQYVFNIVIGQ